MLLVFLFLDKANKEGLRNFSYRYETVHKDKPTEYKDAQIAYHDFEGTDKWTIRIEISGENEISAKHLSRIYEQYFKLHNPIVLVNESAAYLNKKMYPLVNEFERKLREFLYLRMTLYTGEKPKKVVEKLEEKDFGEIFEMLFVDEDFYKQYKMLVTKRPSSKSYFMSELAQMTERTTWDLLVGIVPNDYVKDHFLELTEHRNDVMHAHNISYEKYKRQKNSFQKAITFLNTEIEKLITYPVSQEDAEIAVDALYDKLVSIGKGFMKAVDLTQQIATIRISPEKIEQINKFLTICGQAAIDVSGVDFDEELVEQ